MKKDVRGQDVYYSLAWSQLYKYDRYSVIRIVPEMAGIVSICYVHDNRIEYLMFYSCWRDGCRIGLKKLLDPLFSKFNWMIKELDFDELYYKYTVVDTSIADMQDIMYWLLATYETKYNNPEGIEDSQRYKNIHLKESTMKKDQVIERL